MSRARVTKISLIKTSLLLSAKSDASSTNEGKGDQIVFNPLIFYRYFIGSIVRNRARTTGFWGII